MFQIDCLFVSVLYAKIYSLSSNPNIFGIYNVSQRSKVGRERVLTSFLPASWAVGYDTSLLPPPAYHDELNLLKW